MKTKILKYLNDTLGLQVSESDILYVLDNPANMHGHARKEQRAKWILPYMQKQFWAQQIMPNEAIIDIGEPSDGITSLDKLLWYRDHIYEICGHDDSFLPIFSLYLSKELSVNDIERAWKEKLIGNIKFYPQGGTTNSSNGLRDFSEVQPQLELMNELKIPFSLHGETPTKDGKTCVHRDMREPVFYQDMMFDLMKWYEGPIIAEHISTRKGCEFVKDHANVLATVTPQHMLFTNDAIFHKMKVQGDWYETDIKMALYPSMVCMPVLKSYDDLQAIWQLLVWQYENNLKKVFLGDDTAFHLPENKYTEGCACGVFNSPVSLEMYFMAFNYLDKKIPGFLNSFQAFGSDIGLGLYGIQPKAIFKRVAIVRKPYKVLSDYHGAIPPFAEQTLPWKAIDVTTAFSQHEYQDSKSDESIHATYDQEE